MINGSLNENFNNYMKNIISTLILLIIVSISSIAQENKSVNYGENPDECKKNLTIMQTYYKQKAYVDAARTYRKCLLGCPESSKNIYIIGEKIIKNYIKLNKDNKELKSKYVDSLLMIYDLRMKYFPGDKKSQMKILESKGKALAQYRINSSMEEAYLLLDSAVNYTFPQTKSSTAIRFMYVNKIMNKKGKLQCTDVIKNYLTVENIVKYNSENKNYVKVKQKNLKYADACLECELLDSLYSANFEANQNDSNWLDSGIDLLYEKKCNSSEVLVSMMEKRFESSPAAKTAIVLAAYFGNKERNEKALNYFDKAISMQKDSIKLTKYLVKKSRFQNKTGNYSGARSTANKALIIDPKKAEAYIVIGNALSYGASNCKTLKFGGPEVFWVAVDYYNKAASIAEDPEIKAKALKKAAKNSSYFPREQDIFLKTLNVGDSYKVGCWVNTSTTIRAKK
jgi:tetratricopeptide (TPR) repeat protein